MGSSPEAASGRTEDQNHPLAVRWCRRCRRRCSLEPEWGSVSGLLVCSSCAASANPRTRYNFAEPDPIVDVDPLLVAQHVRLAHVDVLTPRSAIRRSFGRGLGMREVDKDDFDKRIPLVHVNLPSVRRPAWRRRSKTRSRHGITRSRSMVRRSSPVASAGT
jgi:hypothetical protein